ncbi:MAG: hypothetical protein AAGI52_07535 [Bacteroidota bacterium]
MPDLRLPLSVRAALAVSLAMLVATGAARSQPVGATADDGRRVLLFEDGLWADTASVYLGLRDGRRIESATGSFAVYVTDAWNVREPTGEMLQGEIVFVHETDSTYLSPVFVPERESEQGLVPADLVNQSVAELAPGPEHGLVAKPLTVGVVDGRRVFSRRVVSSDGSGFATMQISAIEADGGVLLVIGAFLPHAGDANLMALLRSIEIVEASGIGRPER